MNNYKLTILHLYPDLLNLYGDKGNIECLRKRLAWRGIEAEVVSCTSENDSIDFSTADIIFLGGGSDHEMEIVCEKLKSVKTELTQFVENGGTLLALCGGYPMIGKYYQTPEKTVEGIGLLDIRTELSQKADKLIGNAIVECEALTMPIVGFENHSGRTDIGMYSPLGKVVKGCGNDGKSGYEGVVYKNLTGTYLHGPLLPKNPQLCDRILTSALKNKYDDFKELPPLEDVLESKANEYMVKCG